MENLVRKLRQSYPNLTFMVGEFCCWSPRRNKIFYAPKDSPESIAGLLHEVGHALLHHHTFLNDIDLLQKELAAWHQARELADLYCQTLDESHIQQCLDTYRDWLYQRSHCPACHASGVQQNARNYQCLNCGGVWSVSSSRLRRPYRMQQG